jgi:hypothetical protein
MIVIVTLIQRVKNKRARDKINFLLFLLNLTKPECTSWINYLYQQLLSLDVLNEIDLSLKINKVLIHYFIRLNTRKM